MNLEMSSITMIQNILNDTTHYPTFLLVLLSVCMASIVLILLASIYQAWRGKVNLVAEGVSETLSLLLFPSTYEEGLKNLSTTKDYKYFLPLIQELIIQQRISGASLRHSLEQLRIAIHKDVSFENNQRYFLRDTFYQYILYTLLSWALCGIFYVFEIKLEVFYYLLMFVGQISGFVALIFTVNFYQEKMYKIFNSFAPMLYKSLLLNHFSQSDYSKFMEKAENEVKRAGDKTILRYHKILKDLLMRRNTHGVAISQDLQLLAQDFWYYWETAWTRTKGNIEKMKFFIIMCIFGGAFMMILWAITQELVASMFT
jgi:hypothetical protein